MIDNTAFWNEKKSIIYNCKALDEFSFKNLTYDKLPLKSSIFSIKYWNHKETKTEISFLAVKGAHNHTEQRTLSTHDMSYLQIPDLCLVL